MKSGDDQNSSSEPPAGLVEVAQHAAIANSQLLLQMEQIARALGEAQNQAMKPAFEAASAAAKQIGEAITRIRPVLIDVGAQYRNHIVPVIGEISKALEDLPARLQEGLLLLAQYGWYLDPEMPVSAVTKFKKELAQSSSEDIKAGLMIYFRRSIDRIESDLVSRHPERAKIVSQAFEAHRKGQYALSIPVLLAQTEGICRDLTGGRELFNGMAGYIASADLSEFERAYLHPMGQKIPIIATKQQRAMDLGELNRHAVMHGESTDYDTEENGLKAISLINYVAYAFRRKSTGPDS